MLMQMYETQTIRRHLIGPYDELYAAQPDNILWGPDPSRVVQQHLRASRDREIFLDVGCGDGANALALELAGHAVVGIDISALALRGLQNRFARHGRKPTGTYQQRDIGEFYIGNDTATRFNCIVSCGLFHCLAPSTRINLHRNVFDRFLQPGGTVLFSCLTDKLPLSIKHRTPDVSLATLDEVRELFADMSFTFLQEGEINDRHASVVGAHKHSVAWAIAKANTSH
jgi:SAM-dependent methyltransferase